jgi:nicotinamidase-related amidase
VPRETDSRRKRPNHIENTPRANFSTIDLVRQESRKAQERGSFMKHHGTFSAQARLAAAVACMLALSSGVLAQTIIDEWPGVKVPSPPALKAVKVDPQTTSLLVMGFVRDSCNAQRRPRCAMTIPAVAKLLAGARAHGVFVMHSVPSTNPGSDYIVKELVPLPGEVLIPPNGPNKFLPVDPEFPQFADFALDRILKDKGIRTVITVGTQVQTAVLHTAAEAALRGYKVIVPVDGMSGDSAYPEQYTAWHLANTQRIMQHVTLTKVDLVGY